MMHEQLSNLQDTFMESKQVVIGKHIVFVGVDPDESADKPDWDGNGEIYSFNNRHTNFIGDRLSALKKKFGTDLVPLSYFEHGQCQWGVAGSMSHTPDFEWDGVGFAGVWVPDRALLEEVAGLDAEARRKRMEEFAGQYCETYTQWCNGDVYCCSVTVHRVKEAPSGAVYDRKEDYRFEKPVFDESCCGLYGDESVKEFLEETLKQASTHLKEDDND